jgi:hypothetical protein
MPDAMQENLMRTVEAVKATATSMGVSPQEVLARPPRQLVAQYGELLSHPMLQQLLNGQPPMEQGPPMPPMAQSPYGRPEAMPMPPSMPAALPAMLEGLGRLLERQAPQDNSLVIQEVMSKVDNRIRSVRGEVTDIKRDIAYQRRKLEKVSKGTKSVRVTGSASDQVSAEFGTTAVGADAEGTRVFSAGAETLGKNTGFLALTTTSGAVVYVPYWADILPSTSVGDTAIGAGVIADDDMFRIVT